MISNEYFLYLLPLEFPSYEKMSVDVPDRIDQIPIEILPFLKQRPELTIFGTKTSKPPQSSPHPVSYRCELCPYETAVQQHYQSHMLEHKSAGKECPCPVCGKIYKNESRLQSHMLTHEAEHSHVCMYCEKRFKTPSLLKNHMKTHFPEAINCHLCNKNFSSKNALKRHTQSQHSENYQK